MAKVIRKLVGRGLTQTQKQRLARERAEAKKKLAPVVEAARARAQAKRRRQIERNIRRLFIGPAPSKGFAMRRMALMRRWQGLLTRGGVIWPWFDVTSPRAPGDLLAAMRRIIMSGRGKELEQQDYKMYEFLRDLEEHREQELRWVEKAKRPGAPVFTKEDFGGDT